MKLPALPPHRLTLSKNFKVDDEINQLKELLETLGGSLVDMLPLLQTRFGVSSISDLAGLYPSQLREKLVIDKGRVILADKHLQFLIVDNNVTYSDTETQARTVRKLKTLGLEKWIPDALERWTAKIETGALQPVSGVSCVGKMVEVGGETRLVTAFTSTLILKTEKEEGGILLTEITDEYLLKVKTLKDKGQETGVPDGKPCLYGKLIVDEPFDKDENTACDHKGFMRDTTNAKEPSEYSIEVSLSEQEVAKIQMATQTALGVCPGGVSLAQTYGHLFDHRIKSAEDVAQLNTTLMQAIKSQDVKQVVSLLKQGSSPNFKDEGGWTPLQRACSVRVDTGDLGRNFIACNQIIELLIKAGADVGQTNAYGRTALHYAAMEGNFYAASILVHAGAPVDAKDRTVIPDPVAGGIQNGANAAFHCRLMRKNEWEKVCQLLELYSDEPPPPVAETKSKGKKGKKGKKKK